MRSTKRLLILGVLLGLLLSVWGPSPAAHAEPTNGEKTQAATVAAQSACQSIGASIFGDQATQLCVQTVVAILTDPATATAEVACKVELTALGLGGFKSAQRTCVELVSPLVAGAAAAMAQALDDVVKCVESTLQGDVFACQTQLVQQWIGRAVRLVWTGVAGVLTSPTRAINIIDLRANADAAPEAVGFRSIYGDIGVLAASLVMVFVLLSLVQALIRRSSSIVKESIGGVLAWAVFWVAGMAAVVLILQITDGMTQFLAGENGSKMQLVGIDKWLTQITKVTGMAPNGVDYGSLTGVLLILVVLVAIIVIFVTLALREVSILLMAVMLPVLLAMQAGPGGMRRALPKVATAFVTIAIAKPLMVVGLRLGAGFLSVPSDGKLSLWGGVLGAVVLGLSAFAPGVLYKVFGVMETGAGGRGGGAAQSIDAAGRSAVDLSDSARSVFSANAPAAPVAAKTGGTAAASAGGAGGAAAGGSAAAGASAAAGPLGLVLGAGMMAASTAVSAGGAIASQVATGGGATGDAEGLKPGQFARSYGGGGYPQLPPSAAVDVPAAQPDLTPTPPPPPVPTAKP